MEKIEKLISLQEASALAGYNPDYLSQLIRSGKMQGRRVGRNWFTTREAVTAYLSAKKFVPLHLLFTLRSSRYFWYAIAALFLAVTYAALFFFSGTGRSAVPAASPAGTVNLDSATDGDAPLNSGSLDARILYGT